MASGILPPLKETGAAPKGVRRSKVRKEAVGQRGKDAEKEVTEVLEGWNTKYAKFAFERLPDARAARGMIKAQLSDFMCWFMEGSDRYSIPLEVKSLEHAYRLPKASLDQLPRLKKSALAGAFPFVLVHFKTINKWRIAAIGFFEFGLPSWDMSGLPTFDTPKAAMESTRIFPRSS